jgi:mannose-6-phosphate isomerase-like protein (cupin superfamily)
MEGLMASLQISREEMLKRVAYFKDLIPNDYKAMKGGDSVDQNMLTGFTLIGRITSKNPPAIAGDHGFTVAIQKVKSGYSVSLHSHKMVEVFIPVSGKWKFFWGENGEEGVELGPLDAISFPAGLMEGFRNIGDEEGTLLVLLGAPDIGEVTYYKNEKAAEATA